MPETSPIWVIEDSPDDFEACAIALQKEGKVLNPVVWFQSGSDAIAYLDDARAWVGTPRGIPSLILLDLNLPGLDGREVLSVVKSDPQFRRVPTVVMTTSSSQRDVESCYDAGANGYIVKPVKLNEFLFKINKVHEYWFNTVVPSISR